MVVLFTMRPNMAPRGPPDCSEPELTPGSASSVAFSSSVRSRIPSLSSGTRSVTFSDSRSTTSMLLMK